VASVNGDWQAVLGWASIAALFALAAVAMLIATVLAVTG